MQWSDEGIIIGVRAHGETAAIVDLLTRDHGRHAGLVHGGRSRKLRPMLQTGNQVDVTWKARLAEQLGHFAIEPRRAFAADVLDDPPALLALSSIAALSHLLPERDPHPNLYEVTLFVLGFLDDPTAWPALYVRWELALLDELGFGLDLASCAVSGGNDALTYVSPRSGRAVSESIAEPYRDKLLRLPPFLRPRPARAPVPPVSDQDVQDGLFLTAYFLRERLLLPRDLDLPEPRGRLAAILARSGGA